MKYLITLFFSFFIISCSQKGRGDRLSLDQKPEMSLSLEVPAAKKGVPTSLMEEPDTEPDYTFSLIDKNEVMLTW